MNLQESIRRILKEETEDGMKDILFDMFDESTKEAEIYEYDNSLWMIIPEQKVWIFYISKDGNLLYNYNFFEKIYRYVSLDVFGDKNFITKWVEDIIKLRVRNTADWPPLYDRDVEDIIKKGIKDTFHLRKDSPYQVQDIIKRGKKG